MYIYTLYTITITTAKIFRSDVTFTTTSAVVPLALDNK